MPVRSIITSPANGTELPSGTPRLDLRGAAWNGDHEVRQVQVSIDYGVTWTDAPMQPARNRYDSRRLNAQLTLLSEGYFEITGKATDIRDVTHTHRSEEPPPSIKSH